MRIILGAIGRLKNGPERQLNTRYLERAAAAARQAGLTGVEMREFAESQNRQPGERMQDEARMLGALVSPTDRLVLLDERGKAIGSEAFANDVSRARDTGIQNYVLALGGPDGHGDDMRQRADSVIAFGAMTWPHQLARIMASEQIYRAITILNGHPYHRQ